MNSGTPAPHEWPRIALRWSCILLVFEAAVLGLLVAKTRSQHVLPIYYELIRRFDTVALPAFAVVGLVALLVAWRRPGTAVVAQWVGRHPSTVASIAFAVYAAGALIVYHAHPLSMDEYMPLLQSEIFAAGRLHGSVPAELVDAVVPRHFQHTFVAVNHATGAIASRYWPAFALLQVPFAVVGVNWLFNPLVTALTFPALDSLLRKLGLDPAARGAALLVTAGSAAIAINATSFYAMPLLLLCSIVFTRLILERSAGFLLLAGLVGSIALTAINPVPHALYALPWLLWLISRTQRRWQSLGWLALGYLPLSIFLGFGWPFAYSRFAPSPPHGTGDDLLTMIRVFSLPSLDLVIARVFALVKLDLWGIPGMFALAVAGALSWRAPAARYLAACAVAALIGYLFVPFTQGHGWGYRYFHQAWLTIPVLAGGLLMQLSGNPGLQRRLTAFLVAASLGCLALLVPLRALQVEGFVAAHLAQIPPRTDADGRQVVFVDVDSGCGYYVGDLVQNDPFLRSDELRLASLGEDRDLRTAERFLNSPRVASRTPCGVRWAGR